MDQLGCDVGSDANILPHEPRIYPNPSSKPRSHCEELSEVNNTMTQTENEIESFNDIGMTL